LPLGALPLTMVTPDRQVACHFPETEPKIARSAADKALNGETLSS